MSTDVQTDEDDINLAVWDLPSSIQDDEDVEAIMEKIMDEELAIQKESQKIANIEARKKGHQRRLEWLHKQWDTQLEAYALAKLKDTSKKSIQFTHGKIAYRAAPGGVKVVDEEAAVKWLASRPMYSDCIKKVEVLAVEPKVLAEIVEGYQDNFNPEFVCTFIETTPPGENVTIGAGIIKSPGKRSQLVVTSPPKEPTPIGDLVTDVMHDIESTSLRREVEDEDDDIPW